MFQISKYHLDVKQLFSKAISNIYCPSYFRGSRQEMMNASINSLYICGMSKFLRLTKNMKLYNMNFESEISELQKFSYWVAAVEDSLLGGANDENTNIDIADDIHL